MKKLLIGLFSLASITAFASNDTCVIIDPIEANDFIFEEICAEVDGNTLIYPTLHEDENGNNAKIAVIGLRLKKDASEICQAFGLPDVTKRKNVEREKLTFNDHLVVTLGNRFSVGSIFGKYFTKITCK